MEFFKEASSLIYHWLTEEERVQLLTELHDEDIRNIEELRPDMRFFRLFHFIQVKYIKVEEWVNSIFRNLESISSKSSNFFAEDLVFKDANDKNVSLLDLQERLTDIRPQSIFRNLLEQVELQEQFKLYLDHLKKRWHEW